MKVTVCSHRPILEPCGLKGLDHQVDPYVGCEHCCYYCYALAQAETDWSEEICIHKDIVAQLSAELETISSQSIYMGYHTDPYQPCEAEYQQTRKVLALLSEKGFSASILTKSDLVVRDMDILSAMNSASVSVSVAFQDDGTRTLFEANTVATERRIDALRQFKAAGIRTGVLICPVIPHITDACQLIDMVAPYAETVWIYGLSIHDPSGPDWRNVHQILYKHLPDKAGEIESAILTKDHIYWEKLREKLETYQQVQSLNLEIHV